MSPTTIYENGYRREGNAPGRANDGGVKLDVAVIDHQGKAAPLAAALECAGHAVVADPSHADVLLVDHDLPAHGRLPLVERCVAAGGRAYLYPHGGGASLVAGWDGLYPVCDLLSGLLVCGPGQVEIARLIDYPHPVHVVGFPFCEQRPRVASGRTERILFAPSHPPVHNDRNREIFERLLEVTGSLTVRHIGTLEENGLWQAEGVEYVRGDLFGRDSMVEQIDAADVVVAEAGTFAAMAVARGVATVMWDSGLVCSDDADQRPAERLALYTDFIRFPFDLAEGDAAELIRCAAADEELQAEWRRRFVGGPLDAAALVEAIRGDAEGAAGRRARRLHRAAVRHAGDGDVIRAEGLLSEALAASVDVELLNDLGVVRSSLGALDDAKALLRTALIVDPEREDAQANLAALEGAELPAEPLSSRDEWRDARTLGGPDPHMPERAFPGMPSAGSMSEHAIRYGLALGFLGGLDVLDLGCGTGYGSEMLTWAARSVRGFDLWRPDDAERPRWPGGATLTYGHDLCRDPLPRGNAAVMYEVIEHLDDAPAALRLAWSSVDLIIASFPNPVYHGSHHNHYHVNDWTLEEFERQLADAASVRFGRIEMQHAHQAPAGIVIPGRDPEASFWIVVAAGADPR